MRASETTTPPATGVAPPRETGSRTARDERDALAMARAQDDLNLLGRTGQDDELGNRTVPGKPVALVHAELLRLADDVRCPESCLQLGDE